MNKFNLLIFLLTWGSQCVFCQGLFKVVEQRCELRKAPDNIDTNRPKFSWEIISSSRNMRQSAYELVVGDRLSHGTISGVCWRSGKVPGDATFNIVYSGLALHSLKTYYWKVKIYDQSNTPSEWSDVSQFQTVFLKSSDWSAAWIGDDQKQFEKDEDFYSKDRMPLFKREFKITKKLRSAKLFIVGLGYYESYLNGRKIGKNILSPGFTSYRKSVLYDTYDVSQSLQKGSNTISVMLGNGWYNPLPLRLFHIYNLRNFQQTGRPCVKASLCLKYQDGSVEWYNTDSKWRTKKGPIINNSVYLGETYDARMEVKNLFTPDDKGWKASTIAKGPSGELQAESQPPIRVTKILFPVSIKEVGKDTFIVDMGQNFAGVAKIKIHGPRGRQIKLRYGEDIHPDGRLNYLTTVAGHIKEIWHLSGGPGAPKTAWQEDSYILKGSALEEWAPRFTFHSFRYIQITGWPGKPKLNELQGLRMNADLDEVGTFQCSNPLFNQLHNVIKWTFLSNVFSIQSDCPGREKMGYGGDMVATADAFCFNYNMSHFYRKSIQDFANDQQPDGAITEMAPYTGIADHGYGGQSGPLGWELAFPFLQKKLYDFYGDSSTIRKYYPTYNKQMDFLKKIAAEHFFDRDISDHAALDQKPEALSAAAFYYHHAALAAQFAGLLKNYKDSSKYSLLATEIKKTITEKYEQLPSGVFDSGNQSAQAFALWYNFPTNYSASLDQLLEVIKRKDYHLSTGIFGTKMCLDILRQNNRNDVAYNIVNQRTFPSWGFMLTQGATTLWESWTRPDNATSQNHPMFGSVDEWFFRSLLGINEGAPGFKTIIIKPQPAGDLTAAEGWYHSVSGTIVSSWRLKGKIFVLHVEIPANTTARIYLPSKAGGPVTEGKPSSADVVKPGNIKYGDGFAQINTGSGIYDFHTELD